ncbi:MAG: cyclic-phosphate processing receiver domain-containing protein [Candidatus Pacearchaeota archaeon]
MKYFVWLDDVRPVPNWLRVISNSERAVVHVTSYQECVNYLQSKNVTHISFDYDLGKGKTGYDVAKWIEEAAKNNLIPKIIWEIHSEFFDGNDRISNVMKRADTFWNETQKNPKKKQTYKTQTDLGKKLGTDAKVVGKLLMRLGLKNSEHPYSPTVFAIDSKYAIIEKAGSHDQYARYLWSEDLLKSLKNQFEKYLSGEKNGMENKFESNGMVFKCEQYQTVLLKDLKPGFFIVKMECPIVRLKIHGADNHFPIYFDTCLNKCVQLDEHTMVIPVTPTEISFKCLTQKEYGER